ncbi:VOC family protein [Piscibacillus halophilus]|uniref:Glyoxalase/Bleomycin resistance protein/Dioxygenase superfamily protein n=2 Tax=Piscibacillus halophilus TaxID=571933 RepID=A0A1H9CXN4_9BACI|nr:VOC family protein [Piscibacillus halophilus]SEQ05899.1 Glyoxalase/Bleomycin resistance protein/Dioxygenase superfamily protein [Piscibacillus halophilus]
MITKGIQITIFVRDQEKAKTFYTEKLGFVVCDEEEFAPGWNYLTVAPQRENEMKLELVQAETREEKQLIGKQAAVTVLKAFFNESFTIPNPVEASSDGTSLLPYSGTSLTIGGELNKLATNIAHGRDTAGVHWRFDGVEGLKLGERVAIEIFRNYQETYNEKFEGFSLTRFDGTKITI